MIRILSGKKSPLVPNPNKNPEDVREIQRMRSQIEAINRVQAVIRFALDGTVLDANANFLKSMGYSLAEIKGKHHRLFVDREFAKSREYAAFWDKLNEGQFEQGEFKRIAKDGSAVWLQATYTPVFDQDGQVFEVVKFATDITSSKLQNLEFRGQVEAVQRSQAYIEFALDGTVLTANLIFLRLMGYTLDEVKGRHHSIFVEPGYEKTEEYRGMWQTLSSGLPYLCVRRRIGKNGKEVWMQANYNPILDPEGTVIKIVKLASDLTPLIHQTEFTQHTAKSVASASEEMSASIQEISHNMELSKKATDEISGTAAESGKESANLLNSMKSMEKIVGLIRDIAGRVNMLALNATIEAARAGDAGKGFAVVAGEVKNLSDQTAKATSEIGQEIHAVQQISGKVAASIQQTLDGIGMVGQYVNSVASALLEQTATTHEIREHTAKLASAVSELMEHTRNSQAEHIERAAA